MDETPFNPDLIVADVLRRWPETIPVFLKHRTSCVGCALSSFETLSDVACNYGLSLPEFLEELTRSIESPKRSG